MEKKDAIYFVSDFHLGTDGKLTSKERERKLVRFLDSITHDAETIYLLGDIFDYWFEYNRVIPKGYVRLLGKLANLKDAGVNIEFFTGNHDIWMFKYFEEELDIPIHREPLFVEHDGKKFILAHGDGLGPGDRSYKMIKKVFTNPFLQKLYSTIHPNIGLRLMRKFSSKSRENSDLEELKFLGADREWLVQFCESYIEESEIDYFVFGHRHLPIDYKLSNNHSRYINLGDWLNHFSYAKFKNSKLDLLFFENEHGKIYP
ncbi:UDP-2,3-diacylglucosamine diphosphatase [Portibacter lacus]|uniref:UDP-2,3-diacylglucosamine hydrolase n=1 Tax=Portibacter lacus TaxID=1099794 RepID=A0AA37WEH8_9BACT|nr:UDP-2,3-diacylglucosamine diphosphatase [Portibacter lacus]GLR18791.1 UDP-2,3-diacylglucosamine hydrolase [Portibacter lacus]